MKHFVPFTKEASSIEEYSITISKADSFLEVAFRSYKIEFDEPKASWNWEYVNIYLFLLLGYREYLRKMEVL